MLLSSLCALAQALPPVDDAWTQVPASQALASSVRTVPVLVASWFRIRYRASPSVLGAFALLKMLPKHFPDLGHLLLLYFVLIQQLGCPLGSGFDCHCRSLLDCVALLSIHCWLRAFAYTGKPMIVLTCLFGLCSCLGISSSRRWTVCW